MKRKTSWETITLRGRPGLGGSRSSAFCSFRCASGTEAAKTRDFKLCNLPSNLGLRQDLRYLVDLLNPYRNRRNKAGFGACRVKVGKFYPRASL